MNTISAGKFTVHPLEHIDQQYHISKSRFHLNSLRPSSTVDLGTSIYCRCWWCQVAGLVYIANWINVIFLLRWIALQRKWFAGLWDFRPSISLADIAHKILKVLSEWLIIHNHPWHKSMGWIELGSFSCIFSLKHFPISTCVAINWCFAQPTHTKAINPLVHHVFQGHFLNTVYKSKMPDRIRVNGYSAGFDSI